VGAAARLSRLSRRSRPSEDTVESLQISWQKERSSLLLLLFERFNLASWSSESTAA
jgi:hypothetical protein